MQLDEYFASLNNVNAGLNDAAQLDLGANMFYELNGDMELEAFKMLNAGNPDIAEYIDYLRQIEQVNYTCDMLLKEAAAFQQ